MSRPRFLADNDFIEAIRRGVQRREPAIEFFRVRDLGWEQRPDEEVLTAAAAQQLIVVSHDVNSMSAAALSLLHAGQPMRGLLLVHQRARIAPMIENLILIWAASEAEEWDGLIRFLPL